LRTSAEGELAAIIAGTRVPLSVKGGGTRQIGQTTANRRLEVGGTSGLRLYEPQSLTLVAGAGTPVEIIDEALKARGQCLPFEPMDHRSLQRTTGSPTIGGVVAANISGPRRVQVGACRDFLIGMRFVDGRGKLIRSGGRVMKNVTGYDLVRLLAGSFGTLGVITEVAFKVLPAAEACATVMFRRLDQQAAIAVLTSALNSPYEVTGAAHEGRCDAARTLIRVEGFRRSVEYRSQRLRRDLAQYGDPDILSDSQETDRIWRRIRDVEAFGTVEGDVWKVCVRPTTSPGIIRRVRDQVRCEAVLDWGGGLIWLLVPPGTDLRGLLGTYEGHATLVRGSSETRLRLGTFEADPPPLREVGQRLRRMFDPRAILNPGLMTPGQRTE